jgi:acetyl-CoA acetyltransferase
MTRPIAVVGFAQLPNVRRDTAREETELVQPVINAALDQAKLTRRDIGFTCSGSSDYLLGRPFSFVSALDALAPWPPMSESHVEMDGAWALYEAWVRLQCGDIDTALVYAYGKSSLGNLRDVLAQQLDPYYVAPLVPDSVSLAALQARALLDAGSCSEREMAQVAMRSRRDAQSNPFAQVKKTEAVEQLLREPYLVEPLRKHDCPPISDGACAVVLAAARSGERQVVITGIDHRVEPHSLGVRDLTRSVSTKQAAEHAGLFTAPVDLAELHAPFTHQELLLRRELQLSAEVKVNPSGGALGANPMMVAGLTRIGEAATRLGRGEGKRALAHATSGPCLQQNLVCVLEVT